MFTYTMLVYNYSCNHLLSILGLVVLTTMAGYSLAPGEFSAMTCALASVGTMLCSCSANTINQVRNTVNEPRNQKSRK